MKLKEENTQDTLEPPRENMTYVEDKPGTGRGGDETQTETMPHSEINKSTKHAREAALQRI